MTEPELPSPLATLLERATERVPAPDLARGAWAAAVVRRRRTRSRIVGLGASLAVAATVTAVAIVPHAFRHTAAPLTPASSGPAPALSPRVGHPPARTIRQSEWDPATYDSLPALTGVLPADLEPDPSTTVPIAQDPLSQAVLVVQEYGEGPDIYALGADGTWRVIDTGEHAFLPNAGDGEPHEPAFRGPFLRPASLSPDGRRFVLEGNGHDLVYDLATRSGHRIAGDFVATQWETDGLLTLKNATTAGGLVYDPATGVIRSVHDGLGRVGSPFRLEAASGDEVAFGSLGARHDGLFARTPDQRVMLPIHEARRGYLVDTERLVPRLWLADGSLLFSIRPDDVPAGRTFDGTGAQLFVAWDPTSGILRRVGETSNRWRMVSLADDLIGVGATHP